MIASNELHKAGNAQLSDPFVASRLGAGYTMMPRSTNAGIKIFLLILFILSAFVISAQTKHNFTLGKDDFMLDGKPFQMIGGEMHPARIPKEYWRHRIQMAKAMGCNTIAAYIFWNYHEVKEGVFDFESENRDVAAFINLCKQEGMWVLLRPGPYVCAEWDFGGLPPYLLKIPDIKIRCMDTRYMAAVKRYVERFSKEIVSLQCVNGGPILMVQIENEYGSYANDKTYLSPVSEEEKDFDKIEIRKDFYDAIVSGYISEMGEELTPAEKKRFLYAGKFMIYMQSLRFLTDYLNNDIYYGSKYEGHNFVRAGNQAMLLKKLLEI